MTTTIQWRPSVPASHLHVAWVISQNRPLIDLRLGDPVINAARDLAAAIKTAQLPADRFWRHQIPLSANLANRRQFVETAVGKVLGRGARLDAFAATLEGQLAALDLAIKTVLPTLADDLTLRERPLREQWEARGPGMLSHIGRLIDETLIVQECDVLLVQPTIGGYGEAHLPYNSVRIEGVLANPVSELPEAARLAWLIAQLQLDLPRHSENIHADRLPHVARYAMLVPALLAAESVELVRFTPELIGKAISEWRLTVPPGLDAAAIVSEWWQTYLETRPPWNIALAALDQLFG
jgi:hypothetical protein